MNKSMYSLDDVVIGGSYVVSCIFTLVIYTPFLWIMRTDPQINHHSCIRLMFHLGISDCLQVVGFLLMGFWSLTGYAYHIPYWLNRTTIVLTTQSSWFSYLAFIHLVALNRCAVQCFSATWNDRLFSQKRTTVWICIGWLFAFGVVAAELSPWASCHIYYPTTFVYYFDFSFPNVMAFMRFNWWCCVFNLGMTCIWYTITLVSVRRELSSVGVELNDETKKMERNLLKQAVIICAMMLLTDQYWHNISDFSCEFMSLYCYCIGGYLHIINAAINPIIYITINK